MPTQQAPAELNVPPKRPEAPKSGSPEALLEHAVAFGLYVQQLELQNKLWRQLFGAQDVLKNPTH